MQLVFLTLNAVGFVLLMVAMSFGYVHHEHHVLIGMIANLSAIFTLCLPLAAFVGVSKLVKEHVGRYDLDEGIIDEVNAVFRPFFGTVLASAGIFVIAAILGASLLAVHSLAVVHGIVAILGCFGFIWANWRIWGFLGAISSIVERVEDLIPDPDSGDTVAPTSGESLAPPTPKEGFVSDSVDWSRNSTRGRARIAGGATILLASGHIHIAMTPLGWAWIPIALVAAFLIVVGFSITRSSTRPAEDPDSPEERTPAE